ncbi:hypothetical protein GCM10022200_12660 [Microbacterium awajiense]|uniref:Lipoprotein n=2 Tax=Microbacterium awajiense TaxID=415214 RepID=A0ABP7AG57_9MICO
MISVSTVLAGCVPIGPVYSVLDRDATADDQVPEVVESGAADIAIETARYVGQAEGVGSWLAHATTPDLICLIVYSNAQEWVTGCGGGGTEFGLGGPSGQFVVLPDGASAPNNASQLAENVYRISN